MIAIAYPLHHYGATFVQDIQIYDIWDRQL